MRPTRAVVMLVALLLAVTGCSRGIEGRAIGDLEPPPVGITNDQYGIRAGLADAPVQLELYTEPQCTHCAELQKEFGDQFAYFIGTGQLAITYRPLTFLDTPATNGHSARVANALFTAAAATAGSKDRSATTGRQFQRFVEQLWANQQPGGTGPADGQLAAFARNAGVPDALTRQIEQGAASLNEDELVDMEATNFEFLYDVAPMETGTPTVFDVKADKKVDVYDDDWLTRLMAS